ncbi:hypothetical protein XENTR_v10020327 [Xenopus tropicalis]|nr:hypothetical protein XENTR_v10020327 [Xenopus tropicalis]
MRAGESGRAPWVGGWSGRGESGQAGVGEVGLLWEVGLPRGGGSGCGAAVGSRAAAVGGWCLVGLGCRGGGFLVGAGCRGGFGFCCRGEVGVWSGCCGGGGCRVGLPLGWGVGLGCRGKSGCRCGGGFVWSGLVPPGGGSGRAAVGWVGLAVGGSGWVAVGGSCQAAVGGVSGRGFRRVGSGCC